MPKTRNRPKLPWFRRLAYWAEKQGRKRIIPGRHDNDPYINRYKILRIPSWLMGVYIHHIVRSDDDIILHDHPWPFFHWVLDGEYDEENKKGKFRRKAGFKAFRGPNYAHRIDIAEDADCDGIWTLFIRGPKMKDWGFICRDGKWMFWKDHLKNRNDPNYDC